MANLLYGIAQSVANRFFPDRNKPAALAFTFPFQSQGVLTFQQTIQLSTARLEWITGVFVDNSQNAQQFQLLFNDTGQRITIPAYSQGSFEVLGLISDNVTVTGVSAGNLDITVRFTNYVPSAANSIWSVIDPGTITGAITVNGAVTANPTGGPFATTGGTIATANTPVSLGASSTRKLLHIYNPLVNASLPAGGVLGVGFGSGKNVGVPGVVEIVPGGALMYDGSAIPSNSIWVSSPDAGAIYSFIQL